MVSLKHKSSSEFPFASILVVLDASPMEVPNLGNSGKPLILFKQRVPRMVRSVVSMEEGLFWCSTVVWNFFRYSFFFMMKQVSIFLFLLNGRFLVLKV